MANESKIIRKTDDSAMRLLYDIVGEKVNEIADIDSYYKIDGKYLFLEFIKTEVAPADYDPNQNWNEIKRQISIIWDFNCRAEGTLWLVCYNDKREQFKLFNVSNVEDSKIEFSEIQLQTFDEFKVWFQKLNSDVLKK